MTSATKSYHYVLPTQVLCKCVDTRLDCHSLQAAYKKPGAFDARTAAHDVIVPFDQANQRVLGGSGEPYVNNPLRCPAVVKKYRGQQKNKADWDNLIAVLDAVENASSADFARQVFDQIMAEVYRLLAGVQVVYATPNRVSLKQTTELVSRFTADKSGGDRLEAVCTALFRAVAAAFGLFDDIRRQKVNAADAASGTGADIECRFKDKLALLVEVKDRSLTLTQLDAKLDLARVKKISEILFLAERGVEAGEIQQTHERIKSEFASGQNIYVSNFLDFSTGILILLGEKGRVAFLAFVGQELDKANSSIVHRRAWSQLLKSI
ncbi:MAG: restriction endonuclease, SacI family [Candidatus Eisenbacteria bacterium]|nr:restriction endonuclease, SacI family [Candidatus Eisenbacteria bacterium]